MIAAVSCRQLPVILGTITPRLIVAIFGVITDLVAQIVSNYELVVFVACGNAYHCHSPLVSVVVVIVPETVAIPVTAAPHSIRDMVVQNHSDSSLSQRFNCFVEDFKSGVTKQVWISCNCLISNNWIFIQQFKGKWQTNAIESLFSNLLTENIQRL